MPQQRLFSQPPSTPDVQLPQDGPDTWLDQAMHKLAVGTGLDEQRPGDAGDALAALASILPIGKLAKLLPGLKSVDLIKQETQPLMSILPHEFTPVGAEPPYARPTYPEARRPSPRDGMRSPINPDNGLRRRKANGHQEGS